LYYYYPHPYRKLGGLLKFFVAMAPILLFFHVAGQFSPASFWNAWPSYMAGEFWLRLAMQLCQAYTAIISILWAAMVLRRDPRFVRAWQLGYIGSVVSAAARWPLYLVYGYPRGVTLAANICVTVGVLAVFGLWMLYYARSVRVRTYMGTDRYLRLAFFTKRTRGPAPMVPDGT